MRTDRTLASFALMGNAMAFWRLECRGQLGMARIDPLVTPGKPSVHAHAIHGSRGFGVNPSYDDLMNGDCTSCGVKQDMSAYWAPALYFKHDDGEYELVNQVGGMLAYYTLRPDAKNPDAWIKAFPPGFRMIAGDTTRRNYSVGTQNFKDADPEKSIWAMLGQTKQSDLRQRAIGFNCMDYSKAPEGALYRHYMPEKPYLDANCRDGIRIELMFPSCWNGQDVQSEDHMSHVAYPDLVTEGDCPDGFDVKLPGLFFETIWDTAQFKGVPGEFVLSNGDVQGFGYHGDFINGWPEQLLQDAVDTCLNMSGKQEDCPLFKIQSLEEQNACKLNVPSALANEKTTGKIGKTLPGNVPIRYGPEPAIGNEPPASTAPTSHVPVPTVSYKPGTTSVFLPGGVFKEEPTTTVELPKVSIQAAAAAAPEEEVKTSTASPKPTTAPAPSDPPVPQGYEVVRTDWVTNGHIVSKVVVIETVEYVMLATATETVTVTASFGAEKARRELHHLHRHRSHGLH